MTLKEFLEYREHRFDSLGLEDPFYRIYAEGYSNCPGTSWCQSGNSAGVTFFIFLTPDIVEEK